MINHGAIVAAVKYLYAASQLVVTFYLASLLLPEDFGVFFAYVALVNIVGLTASYGLDKYVISQQLLPGLRAILNTSAIVLVAVILLSLATTVLGFQRDYENIIVFGLTGFFLGVSRVQNGYLRVAGNFLHAELVMGLTRNIVLVLTVYAVKSIGADEGLVFDKLAMLYLFSVFMAGLIAMAMTSFLNTDTVPRINSMISGSAMFMGITFGNTLLAHGDVAIMGHLASDEETAKYAIAFKLCMLVSIGATSINAIVAPRISRFYRNGEIEHIQQSFKKARVLSASIAIATSLALLATYKPLLTHFNAGYMPSSFCVNLLIFSQILNAAFGPVNQLAMFAGMAKHSMIALLIAAFVNTALNIALIPTMGTEGAAIAFFFSTIIWNVYLSAYPKRRVFGLT